MVGSIIDNPNITKAGTIIAWGASIIPHGWLSCDGSAISRTKYKALFNVIGTTYGAGDGSTTFNLPNGKIAVANTVAVRGNGKTIGFYDGGSGYFGLNSRSVSGYAGFGYLNGSSYNTNAGSNISPQTPLSANITAGLTNEKNNSGIVTDFSDQRIAIIKY